MSLTDLAEEQLLKSGPYNEGYDAYLDGCLYELNPYAQYSIAFQQWADGWVNAEENFEHDDPERE